MWKLYCDDMTKEEFVRLKPLAIETRDAMDNLNAKKSSPGQRYYSLLRTSHRKAWELGYAGTEKDWLMFVKRAQL
jgi:hypothetical protein